MESQEPPFLVLPRPGAPTGSQSPPIPAPTEADMTTTFGHLLPPASYLTTPHGRAAYYLYPPTTVTATNTTTTTTTAPTRIVLVHGIQTPALGLHPLAAALRAQFPAAQIALFDHWGHGLSDTPRAPHTPALFHGLIDALLARLGWPSAHFVGYSFGAVTIAAYAASSRNAGAAPAPAPVVQSMVLVAPAGMFSSEPFGEQVNREYLAVPATTTGSSSTTGGGEADDKEEEREKKARDWILDFLEGGPLVIPTDWRERVARGEVVAEAVKDWEMRAHRGHAASVVAIFRDGELRDNRAAFARAAEAMATGTGNKDDNNCLVVLGEQDGLSAAADFEAVGLRNVVVVPRVGHGVVREKVPEVAAHIGDFWRARGL